MELFYNSLNNHFPDAVNNLVFLGNSIRKLNELGFTRQNTLAAHSICRDEILAPIRAIIRNIWGESFMLGGLAGMLSAGKTGIHAFSQHAPNISGERYLFIIGPHITIDKNGNLASIKRRDRSGESAACGSLISCLNKFKNANGEYQPEFNHLDICQYFVESSLTPFQKEIIASKYPEVVICKKALELMINHLELMREGIIDYEKHKVAVLSGIFIHAPEDHHDYFSPGECYTVINNEKKQLLVL